MDRRVRFAYGMSALVVLALLGGAAPSGAASGDSRPASAASAPLAPVRFAPAGGWQVRVGRAHACVGVSASRCSQVTTVASTTRLRDCLECLPHRTVDAMGASDIVIKTTLAVEHPSRIGHTCAWPASVTSRRVSAGFQGLPRRIGVFQCQTGVGAREVFVFIVFGRAQPTRRQLDRANAELQRARVG